MKSSEKISMKDTEKSVNSSQNKENSLQNKELIMERLREREKEIEKLKSSELSLKIEENLSEIVRTIKHRKDNFLKYLDLEQCNNQNKHRESLKKNLGTDQKKRRESILKYRDILENSVTDKIMSLDSIKTFKSNFMDEIEKIKSQKDNNCIFTKIELDDFCVDQKINSTIFNLEQNTSEIQVFFKVHENWKFVLIKIEKEKYIIDLKFEILKEISKIEKIKLVPLNYIIKIWDNSDNQNLNEEELESMFDVDENQTIELLDSPVLVLVEVHNSSPKIDFTTIKQVVDPDNQFFILNINSLDFQIKNCIIKLEKTAKANSIFEQLVFLHEGQQNDVLLYQKVLINQEFLLQELNPNTSLLELSSYEIVITFRKFKDTPKKISTSFFIHNEHVPPKERNPSKNSDKKKINKKIKKNTSQFVNITGNVNLNGCWNECIIKIYENKLIFQYKNIFKRLFYDPFKLEFKNIISFNPKFNGKLVCYFYDKLAHKKKMIVVSDVIYEIANKFKFWKEELDIKTEF